LYRNRELFRIDAGVSVSRQNAQPNSAELPMSIATRTGRNAGCAEEWLAVSDVWRRKARNIERPATERLR